MYFAQLVLGHGHTRLLAALAGMLLRPFKAEAGGDVINRRQWSDKSSAP